MELDESNALINSIDIACEIVKGGLDFPFTRASLSRRVNFESRKVRDRYLKLGISALNTIPKSVLSGV